MSSDDELSISAGRRGGYGRRGRSSVSLAARLGYAFAIALVVAALVAIVLAIV